MMRFLFPSACLLFVACGGDARDPVAQGESTGALEEAPASFELIQQGAFDDVHYGARYVPRMVHIGFANDRGGPWEAVRDIDISYSNERNEAVKIDVPAEHRSKRFMLYSLRYDAHGPYQGDQPRSRWISDLAVDLKKPAGRYITVPIHGGAGYPFSPECYGGSVRDEGFNGKLSGIIYGFTKSSRSDYDANNDVPWQNVEGQSTHEGFLSSDFQHDGGYKGTYVSRPIWVRVPDGRNLVFKASLKRFSGICQYDDDTQEISPPNGQDSHLTKTYFVENN
jgi:hypothetical protein